MDFVTLDESALGGLSKELYRTIVRRFPELNFTIDMSRSHEKDGQSIFMRLSSPTNVSGRDMMVWVDEYPSPSLEFGPSHCHESADQDGCEAIAALIALILTDVLVIITEIGSKHPDYARWLNLSEPDALAEELTDPYSTGHLRIESWTGAKDREVRLSDVTI